MGDLKGLERGLGLGLGALSEFDADNHRIKIEIAQCSLWWDLLALQLRGMRLGGHRI